MKNQRLYSLFEKTAEGKWARISDLAFTKRTAVQVFQGALLAYVFGTAKAERSLRVVKS